MLRVRLGLTPTHPAQVIFHSRPNCASRISLSSIMLPRRVTDAPRDAQADLCIMMYASIEAFGVMEIRVMMERKV